MSDAIGPELDPKNFRVGDPLRSGLVVTAVNGRTITIRLGPTETSGDPVPVTPNRKARRRAKAIARRAK